MAHILWVEDQYHWIEQFSDTLINAQLDNDQQNKLTTFKFAEAACQFISQSETAPDIALLDANMHGNDHAGFSVSRALTKKWPKVPVIYLSEHSGTGIEQEAFEKTSAQDFIAKHQNNIEQVLCWRLKRALRHNQVNDENSEGIIKSGELTIDTNSWNVYWHGERLMNPANPQRPLAPTPRKILRFLVEASPRPITTQQIAEKLEADLEKFSYANYRQHIKTLRHSFAQTQKGDFIDACKRGQGIATFGDQKAYCWIPIK